MVEIDERTKGYPIKILDDLYVRDILNSNVPQKQTFVNMDNLDRIEFLLLNNPNVRKVKLRSDAQEFFTPSFGDFIVSVSKEKCLKYYNNEYLVKTKAEELFLKLKKTHRKMNYIGNKMKDFVQNYKVENPKRWKD